MSIVILEKRKCCKSSFYTGVKLCYNRTIYSSVSSFFISRLYLYWIFRLKLANLIYSISFRVPPNVLQCFLISSFEGASFFICSFLPFIQSICLPVNWADSMPSLVRWRISFTSFSDCSNASSICFAVSCFKTLLVVRYILLHN